MDTSSYRAIGKEELKKIQLEILDAFDSFCRERGIEYTLAYGTLLGAARHGGYIPWDDDIDVSMLREDYDRLIKEFPERVKGRYELHAVERDRKWPYPYGKITDSSTLMVEETNAPAIGINIDIFPMDNCPSDPKRIARFDRSRKIYTWIYNNRFFRGNKAESMVGRFKQIIVKMLTAPVPLHALCRRINRNAQRFNREECSLVMDQTLFFAGIRPFEKKLFEDSADIQFETRTYMGISDYDSYLGSAYGDWRQLPPEKERVSHHSYKAYAL